MKNRTKKSFVRYRRLSREGIFDAKRNLAPAFGWSAKAARTALAASKP